MRHVKYAGLNTNKTTSIYYIKEIKESIKADLIWWGFSHSNTNMCIRVCACLNTYV